MPWIRSAQKRLIRKSSGSSFASDINCGLSRSASTILREFVLEELRLPGLSWSGDREWAVRQTCPVLCAGLVRCSLPPRPSIREVLAVDRLPSAPRGESWVYFENVAVTLLLLVTLDNTQLPVPEQSPDHPTKRYPSSVLVYTDNVTPE